MSVVLVIAPHADDEVLGCGGAILRHVARGDEVHVALVARGDVTVFPASRVAKALQEFDRAQHLLGVTQTHYLDFLAPRLDTVPGCVLAEAILRVIRDVRPETVYTCHGGDLHADHRAVYTATLVAGRPVGDCSVRRLLCYEVLSETDWAPPTGADAFVPTVFVNIEEYLDRKLEAMACYQTQLRPFPASRSLEAIEALARVRGAAAFLPAAEAFMVVREVQS